MYDGLWTLNFQQSKAAKENIFDSLQPLGAPCARAGFAHVEYYHFATHFALVVWYPHVGPAVKNVF